MSAMQGESGRSKLSPKWQRRFTVFDEANSTFNVNSSPTYKSMGFLERTTITFNLWALFFGIIYYFVLGIPRRGIGIFACSIIVWLMLYALDMSTGWYRIHSIATQTVFAVFVNYYYYIRVTQGRDEWDPARDLRHV